ncbi:bifunctional DNA-formamidopyrimidine glycosylase/DNA-(apurinic or apyrimidinic site) lyase [Beggiatoa leptomitoformis]|uniref:Formamidopyrimidine-DNA glycosylase n=1 Tax=Beggiatoa leptomitoformis TaxID=288004 RepID=A0A2N9YI98_9GAMM|nr:bifunctional DNA-formamidopyrimidine glycosylase/DNA-(apurinic or apyrimidinic site) lyase [Beggiatoa leptomitoformis]ALG67537.1 bifunctional DNA-formamidopyrimidine glycosylase/DNA-(apurinic or apyrimidinic site) lyase [Beggiatoa leptomitoformis]AUI70237.1 bifunctional DNA-formamidopyrimidine glycosylase/DNA-(apurinic or apyrimidinic site) lyase [Beggiatoa leptomitoformis]
MPELPEVETTRRGIAQHLEGRTVTAIDVRESRLRWAVPSDLATHLLGQPLQHIQRRGKYLLFAYPTGHLIIHLGMSGSLRIVSPDTPLKKHDHVLIQFGQTFSLRYHDPRRFGCVLWTSEPVLQHPLLASLGVEPLENEFTGKYLQQKAGKKQLAVKTFIMNSHVVVGVGNIYASESLFLAGIHPTRAAGEITLTRYEQLASTIREVLTASIAMGGTTLRDFVNTQGEPGYFSQTLRVYDRATQACVTCNTPIERIILGQRATYYCPHCQT